MRKSSYSPETRLCLCGDVFYVDPPVIGLYLLFFIECIKLQSGATPYAQMVPFVKACAFPQRILSGCVCPEKSELFGLHACSSNA